MSKESVKKGAKPVKAVGSTLRMKTDYLETIGLIIVEINNLDAVLGRILGGLLGINQEVATIIYLTPKSSAARLEILENIMKKLLLDSKGKGALVSLIKRARRIFQNRHCNAHGVWHVVNDTVQLADNPIYAVGKKSIPVKLEELKTYIKDIQILIAEVIDMADSLYMQNPLAQIPAQLCAPCKEHYIKVFQSPKQ